MADQTFICDSCDKTYAGKPAYGYHGTQKTRNRYGRVIWVEDVDIDICEMCSAPYEEK